MFGGTERIFWRVMFASVRPERRRSARVFG